MHEAYGGVVPELASRDHVRRVVPLAEQVLAEAGLTLPELDGIAYTQGPGLAGALLVGASVAHALGYALGKPTIGVHHLEGHLLSPLLSEPKPAFPVRRAARVRRTQPALRSRGRGPLSAARRHAGRRGRRGVRQDGEAPRPAAIPAGPALARLAASGRAGAVSLPRPMLESGDLDISFSGLKTAVLTLVRREAARGALDDARRADIAREFQHAVVDVLVAKALAALGATGCAQLVVAGGVGANRELRARLAAGAAARGATVFFPATGVLHRQRRDDRAGRRAAARGRHAPPSSRIRCSPRWDLASLRAP